MKPRKRTNAYWDKRSQEQLTLVEQQALPLLKEIDRVFRNSQKQTLKDVKNLYEVYYRKQGFDTTALKAIAPNGDIRRFKESVKALGLSSRLPAGYGYRLTRLELIEAQIWLEVAKGAKAQNAIQGIAHRQTIDTAYYHSVYNLSKGTGIVPTFSQLDNRTIKKILDAKFYKKDFSTRIWGNNNKLNRDIKGILSEATTTGQSNSKTARLLRNRFDVTRYEAQRLVQTETAHFNFASSQEVYDDIGIGRWKFVATLDSRTGDECGTLDGTIHKIGEGPTIPIHPNCRCVDAPFIDKAYEPDERIMRQADVYDQDGNLISRGKNKYIGNISFDEWKKLYPDDYFTPKPAVTNKKTAATKGKEVYYPGKKGTVTILNI